MIETVMELCRSCFVPEADQRSIYFADQTEDAVYLDVELQLSDEIHT